MPGLLPPILPADTEPVRATVLSIEPVCAGRLLGFASVEIEIAGIVFELHGVRVIRTPRGTIGVDPPQYRGSAGASLPAVILPPELVQAIGGAVLDAAEFHARRVAIR